MKKKILSMALAIIAAGSVAVSAQTPDNNINNGNTTEQCARQCNGKCIKNDHKKMARKGHKPRRPNLFQGIELTAEQQTAINNLKEQNKTAREQARKDRQAAREQKQAEMNNALEQILTPEQYAQYQANVQAAKSQRADKNQGRRHHGNKNGKQAQRTTNSAEATADLNS